MRATGWLSARSSSCRTWPRSGRDPGRSPGHPRRDRRGGRGGQRQVVPEEQIKRFAIVPAFWEPGGDEITPTMKLKRRAITTKYADVIESLYATAAEPAQAAGSA